MLKAGRPSKFTAKRKKKILAIVRDGNYISTACSCANISKKTFYNWVARAKAGEIPYLRFIHSLKRAESDAEADAVAKIKVAGKRDWVALMTFLERRHSLRWGRNKVDISEIKKRLDELTKEVQQRNSFQVTATGPGVGVASTTATAT